ncbi:hypothetical protein MMC12_005214 [Toensbergia leucococca]|nr:hypothetical protein [Toensbergia leucococca]
MAVPSPPAAAPIVQQYQNGLGGKSSEKVVESLAFVMSNIQKRTPARPIKAGAVFKRRGTIKAGLLRETRDQRGTIGVVQAPANAPVAKYVVCRFGDGKARDAEKSSGLLLDDLERDIVITKTSYIP